MTIYLSRIPLKLTRFLRLPQIQQLSKATLDSNPSLYLEMKMANTLEIFCNHFYLLARYTLNTLIISCGYAELCKTLENIKSGSTVIIQLNKHEVLYYRRRSNEWAASWTKIIQQLAAKNTQVIFSGFIPSRQATDFWYDAASLMDICMTGICNYFHQLFCAV